jgi:hypothetical protein
VDLTVDADIAGNTATSVGTVESCNAIPAVGDTLEVDVVVQGVPPYDPESDSGALMGFQFNLLYDPTVVNVTAHDPEMMLAADPESILIDISDAVPDMDGDWLAAAADLGKGEASGDGVLMRITLEAVGDGTSALQLDGVKMVGHPIEPYPISGILDGEVVVGAGSCNDDLDGDGFTNAQEAFVGTDPADACPDDEDDDAWPSDLATFDAYGKHDGKSDIFDINELTPPYFGKCAGDPLYTNRKDFSGLTEGVPDGCVNIFDVTLLTPPVFGTSCTP